MKKDRLIKKCNDSSLTFGEKDLTDYLRVIAINIEDSMIEAGAVPGKDYTFIDIYKMAMQYVSINSENTSFKIEF